MTRDSDCRSALQTFASRRLSGWEGLPRCTRAELDAMFTPVTGATVRGTLGEAKRSLCYVNYQVPGYGEYVSAWLDGDDVVMLETEHPALEDSPDAIRAGLGDPEGTFDFRIHVAVEVEGGVWAWPSRGLALYVNPRKDNYPFRVAVFAPTTLEQFARDRKIDPDFDED